MKATGVQPKLVTSQHQSTTGNSTNVCCQKVKHRNPDKVSNQTITNITKDHVKAKIKAHIVRICKPEK
eukprot:7451448-Heterocapsa_arctica.AAC.1